MIPFPDRLRPSARHPGEEGGGMSAVPRAHSIPTGRVPPLQQTRVAAFLISAHGALARQLAIALPGQIECRLANRTERAVLSRSRNRLPAACVRPPGCRISRLPYTALSWETAWLPTAGRRDCRSNAGDDHRHRRARRMPSMPQSGRRPCCRLRQTPRIPS